MMVLLGVLLIALALLTGVKVYADKHIGESASFEQVVDKECLDADLDYNQAFGDIPEVSSDDELIRETHNTAPESGNESPVSLQPVVPTHSGDEGHSGASDEGTVVASAHAGHKQGPKAIEPDKGSDAAIERGTASADVNDTGKGTDS